MGGFSQTAAGKYVAEIDGLLVGSQYDLLRTTGGASLAGKLDFQVNQNGGAYADPSVPGTFDAFQLLTGSGIGGAFDSVRYDGTTLVPVAPPGPGGDFVALAGCGLFRIMDYSANGVTLTNYQARPGDANADGVVDGSDFGIWNAYKFTSGSNWARGDFNCDRFTNEGDFDIWNAYKFTGTSLPISMSDHLPHAMLQSVPEPTGWLVWVLAAVSSIPARRRGPQ